MKRHDICIFDEYVVNDNELKKELHTKNSCETPYHLIFDKKSGLRLLWGNTKDDDPQYCPWGPELFDIEITTSCDGQCQYCSPAGTLVSTVHGEQAIETLHEGDLVISYNENSSLIKVDKIEEVYSHDYIGEIIEIEIDNRVLKLTPDHDVYTTRGWVSAGELSENDELLCLSDIKNK